MRENLRWRKDFDMGNEEQINALKLEIEKLHHRHELADSVPHYYFEP